MKASLKRSDSSPNLRGGKEKPLFEAQPFPQNIFTDFAEEQMKVWRLFTGKTSQELRMLSSVTLDCQATKIVMNSGSQLSEL